MKFTLVTFGSEGDTRPFVALAQGLIKAGHEVLLFGEQSGLARAQQCKVPSQVLAGDVKAALPVLGAGDDITLKLVFKSMKDIKAVINDNTASWLRNIALHARSSDAVLYSGLAYCHGEAVAHALGKPGIALMLQPVAATSEFTSWGLPPLNLPRWMNRLSYAWSLTRVLRMSCGKKVKALRNEILDARVSAVPRHHLTLYGISRHLIAPPADWPPLDKICGQWALEPDAFVPSRELEAYLAAGPAPIYVGLGSASSFIGHTLLTTIVSAVAGRRAVFFPGWSNIDATRLPDNFFVLEHVPHAWLFPRVSMVMHHCGAGTTHSACRAGVPSVALPMGGDQPHWARLLVQAGVAAKPVNLRKLTVASLRGMMAFAERPETRDRCRALGVAMSQESGVGTAVGYIEAYLGVRYDTRQDFLPQLSRSA